MIEVLCVVGYVIVGSAMFGYISVAKPNIFDRQYPDDDIVETDRVLVAIFWPIYVAVQILKLCILTIYYLVLWPSSKMGSMLARKAGKTKRDGQTKMLKLTYEESVEVKEDDGNETKVEEPQIEMWANK
jgi:hypothetical protein